MDILQVRISWRWGDGKGEILQRRCNKLWKQGICTHMLRSLFPLYRVIALKSVMVLCKLPYFSMLIAFSSGKGTEYTLNIWDIAGQEDYDRLRVFSYSQTDVFLFFFSVINPMSFTHLLRKWIPEVATHCPYAGRVLVGVDKRLRTDESRLQSLKNRGMRPVTESQALEPAHSMDAQSYVECDSLTQENIVVPFQQVSMCRFIECFRT